MGDKVSPNLIMAFRTLPGKPVEHFPTLGATSDSFLLFRPLLDPMLLHVIQILNYMLMMRDAIDNMDISKIFEPLAGEFRALKTPRHLLLTGTLAKAVPAIDTDRKHSVCVTAIAASFFDRNTK